MKINSTTGFVVHVRFLYKVGSICREHHKCKSEKQVVVQEMAQPWSLLIITLSAVSLSLTQSKLHTARPAACWVLLERHIYIVDYCNTA